MWEIHSLSTIEPSRFVVYGDVQRQEFAALCECSHGARAIDYRDTRR
jgi:hypothetical protein